MSDGNYHRSPLPQNPFLSGVHTGEARMRQRAIKAFREWLEKNSPDLTAEDMNEAEQTFRKLLQTQR